MKVKHLIPFILMPSQKILYVQSYVEIILKKDKNIILIITVNKEPSALHEAGEALGRIAK